METLESTHRVDLKSLHSSMMQTVPWHSIKELYKVEALSWLWIACFSLTSLTFPNYRWKLSLQNQTEAVNASVLQRHRSLAITVLMQD